MPGESPWRKRIRARSARARTRVVGRSWPPVNAVRVALSVGAFRLVPFSLSRELCEGGYIRTLCWELTDQPKTFGVPHQNSLNRGDNLSASAARVWTPSGCPPFFVVRCYIYSVGHQPGGTWGRARRLTAVTGGPGAAVAAVVAVSGLGSAGGVGYCGRLGTLRNGSRPRGTAGAAAGGVANRSIRAWSGSGPGSGSGPDYGPDYGPD